MIEWKLDFDVSTPFASQGVAFNLADDRECWQARKGDWVASVVLCRPLRMVQVSIHRRDGVSWFLVDRDGKSASDTEANKASDEDFAEIKAAADAKAKELWDTAALAAQIAARAKANDDEAEDWVGHAR